MREAQGKEHAGKEGGHVRQARRACRGRLLRPGASTGVRKHSTGFRFPTAPLYVCSHRAECNTSTRSGAEPQPGTMGWLACSASLRHFVHGRTVFGFPSSGDPPQSTSATDTFTGLRRMSSTRVFGGPLRTGRQAQQFVLCGPQSPAGRKPLPSLGQCARLVQDEGFPGVPAAGGLPRNA